MKSNNGIAAVVLAGGQPHDPLADAANVTSKALIPLQGKPMAQYALRALKDSHAISFISYVGSPDPRLEPYADVFVPSGKQFNDSLALGFGAALSHAALEHILILTADIPWITGAGIDAFIREAAHADLSYAVIAKAAAEQQFPDQKRTFVKVKEGMFTGGNVVLIKPSIIPAVLEVAGNLHRNRKNPLGLAQMFGLDILLKVALGRVSITELEARASQKLQANVRAQITQDASLGADVDKTAHLSTESLARLAPLT